MTTLRVLICRLRSLFAKGRRDARLNEEIETHLALLTEERMSRGMSHAEARALARATFGGVELIKETYREQRGLPFIDSFAQDFRFAARMLRKNPGFATVAILTLGLGIGANTAIFSLLDVLMLRHLPVERPQELVRLAMLSARGSDNFSYSAFRQFRDGSAHVADVIAADATRSITATVDGVAEVVNRKSVSGNYFAVLGVGTAAGRTFTAAEDNFGASPPVAVLSHHYWTRRFGQDRAVIGRTVTIGAVFTIVGVAEPGFFGETVGESPDIWTPLTADAGRPAAVWTGHGTTWLRIVTRRRPGVSLEEARAAFEPIYTGIVHEAVATMKISSFRNEWLQSRLAVEDGSRGLSQVRERLSGPLYVLMAVVGIVLLIACANVANLLLARAAVRQREISLRIALGAGHLRLVRQLFVEALLLASAGGAVGIVLGLWSAKALVVIASKTPLPLRFDVGLDERVLAFTAGLSFVTSVVFGVIPALRAARPRLLPALKEASGIRAPGHRLGKTVVVAQIALSLVLLVGAGLFIRSLMNLRDIDLGFNPDRVLVLRVDAGGPGVSADERRNIYARLVERAESVPGVQAASLSFVGTFSSGAWGNRITVEGRVAPLDEPERTFANAISPRYFEVMEMQLLRGRDFSPADRGNAQPVAIVNETFARQFFSDPSPIGRHVGLGAPAKTMMEIVGVVGDAKYGDLRESARPMLYVPFTQYQTGLNELQVRTAANPASVAAQLRRELGSVDRRAVVVNVMEMQEQVDASIIGETLIARFSSLFGLLALLLSAVGLYGVVAYMSAQRTTEIGIRLALGADRRNVLWLVMRQALMLVMAGILVGLPAALAGSRLISSQLYDLSPGDPVAIAIAVVTLLSAATLAAAIPARRASQLSPAAALKAE